MRILASLLALFASTTVWAYSNEPNACDVNHGSKPPSGDLDGFGGYDITITPSGPVRPGAIVTFNLTGPARMKGFLLQGLRGSFRSSSEGGYDYTAAMAATCGASWLVAHKDPAIKPFIAVEVAMPTSVSSISTTWAVPVTAKVVETYDIWFTFTRSFIIPIDRSTAPPPSPPSPPALSPPPAASPPPPVLIGDLEDLNPCGSNAFTAGRFTKSRLHSTMDLYFESKTNSNGEATIDVAMLTSAQGYVSIGFTGKRGMMYPAVAVIASMSSDGSANIRGYLMTSYEVLPRDELQGFEITNKAMRRTSAGTAYCFTIKADQGPHPAKSLGFTDAIWATNGMSNHFSEHAERGAVRIDFKEGKVLLEKSQKYKMYLAHGVCLMIAFLFLMPLGGIFGSFKELGAKGKIFGNAAWFQLHRGLMMLAAVLSSALIILSFVEFKALEETAPDVNRAHGALGIVMFALTVFQIGWATYARPLKNHPFRPTWNMVHKATANSLVFLLAPPCIFTGIYALKEKEPLEDLVPWLASAGAGCVFTLMYLIAQPVAKRLSSGPAPPPPAAKGSDTPASSVDIEVAEKRSSGSSSTLSSDREATAAPADSAYVQAQPPATQGAAA